MGYRDDRDALLARSDALQRENERLESDLSSAAGERDELKRALADNQKALAKMRKQLERFERKPNPAARARVALLIGTAVALLVAGAVAAIIMAQAGKAAEMRAPEPTEPAGDVRRSP